VVFSWIVTSGMRRDTGASLASHRTKARLAETSDLWMMAAPDSKSFGEANIGGDHFEIVAIALAGSRPRCIVILSTDIRYLHSGDGVRWYEYSVGTGPKPNMIDVTLELHVDVSGGFRSHD
jgi:hypothetical protein